MFSKILIKLIDEAVTPALILVAVRLISIFFVSNYFNIEFTIGPTGFLFRNAEQYRFVNSYSILALVLVLGLGLGYILFKAYLFHETHIKPHDTAKLFSLKLSSFIQSSFDIYSQGAIWLSYSYLLLFVLIVMALFQWVYTWVFVVSLIVSIITTVFFVLDVERELLTKTFGRNPFTQVGPEELEEEDDALILELEDIEL